MADLTLIQRFGTNVNLNATAKTLTINLNDFTDSGDILNGLGLDISGLTEANKDSYASRILYTLLLLNFQQQPATNTDDTVAIYLTSGGRRDAIRNGVSQFNYIWQVNNYTNNNLPDTLDPDQMVA